MPLLPHNVAECAQFARVGVERESKCDHRRCFATAEAAPWNHLMSIVDHVCFPRVPAKLV